MLISLLLKYYLVATTQDAFIRRVETIDEAKNSDKMKVLGGYHTKDEMVKKFGFSKWLSL